MANAETKETPGPIEARFDEIAYEIAKDKYNPENINEFNKQQFKEWCGV